MITKFLPYKGHCYCCQGQYDHNCCLLSFRCRYLELCQFFSYLKSNKFQLPALASFFIRLYKHRFVSLRITRSRFESAKVAPSVLVDLFTWIHLGEIALYSQIYPRANRFQRKYSCRVYINVVENIYISLAFLRILPYEILFVSFNSRKHVKWRRLLFYIYK